MIKCHKHRLSLLFLMLGSLSSKCIVGALMLNGLLEHHYHSPLLPFTKRNVNHSTYIPDRKVASLAKMRKSTNHKKIFMLRNFDLPEVLIFYGMDTFVQGYSDKEAVSSLQPGVSRILAESKETSTCVILLSESQSEKEMQEYFNLQPYRDLIMSSGVHIRSSLDMKDPAKFSGRGQGHAPCPAALLDAISSVEIQPKGFGGSSGFGTKQAEPIRSPLPKHAVVFVSGPKPTSRGRSSAARLAGMRVIYIEKDGIGSCDADDLVDGVVETLGTENDWEMITLDDISTPGSFWLNPPNPRDDAGDRVNPDDIVAWFLEERNVMPKESDSNSVGDSHKVNQEKLDDELSEDDFESILADLDPL